MTKRKLDFEDDVICNYINCNKIFNNPVILPCGNRICKEHVDELIQEIKEENGKYVECLFCKDQHKIKKNGFNPK